MGEGVGCTRGSAETRRGRAHSPVCAGARYRVLCPDTLGRGLSQWSVCPQEEYLPTFYAKMAVEMLDSLGVDKLRWVGTSMGGIVGMILAVGQLRGRITQLVLNDIAPVLNPAAVERIKSYVGATPEFDTVQEVEAALRLIYKPFGTLSDEEWRTMAVTSCRRLPSGKLTLHYDPSVMDVRRLPPPPALPSPQSRRAPFSRFSATASTITTSGRCTTPSAATLSLFAVRSPTWCWRKQPPRCRREGPGPPPPTAARARVGLHPRVLPASPLRGTPSSPGVASPRFRSAATPQC